MIWICFIITCIVFGGALILLADRIEDLEHHSAKDEKRIKKNTKFRKRKNKK